VVSACTKQRDLVNTGKRSTRAHIEIAAHRGRNLPRESWLGLLAVLGRGAFHGEFRGAREADGLGVGDEPGRVKAIERRKVRHGLPDLRIDSADS